MDSTSTSNHGNREYRSDVFSMLMDIPENALSVYNALLGSSQPHLDDRQFETILNEAIDECIENNVLRDFLIHNRNEVLRVTTLDYSFERRMELNIAEARSAGIAEGKAAGIAEGKAAGIAEGKATGVAQLSKAIQGLKNGLSKSDLLEMDLSEEIIDQAILLME